MSLSNNSTANWGTIFMGPERLHETTLSKLESSKSTPLWGGDTEVEYFERIKSKATQKAMQILAQAQADADAMLLKAEQQGYEQGLAQAQAELDEFRQAAGDTAAAVLSAIEAQSHALTSVWEKELTQLVKIAVEAGIGRELSENRAATLGAMFHNAVQELASEQRALVLVNPEDEAVVADIIAAAGQNLSEHFQTKGDPTLPPGSIVLESNFGRLENTLEKRRQMIDKILAELVLDENNNPEIAQQNNLASSPASQPEISQPEISQAVETEAQASQIEQPAELAASVMGATEPNVEEISVEEVPELPADVLVEQVSEEVVEQASPNSSVQEQETARLTDSFVEDVEEDIVSPLDSLTIEEGSLIPDTILTDSAVQAEAMETEPASPILEEEIADSPSETHEELLQAQNKLAALDDLLEHDASSHKVEQTNANSETAE